MGSGDGAPEVLAQFAEPERRQHRAGPGAPALPPLQPRADEEVPEAVWSRLRGARDQSVPTGRRVVRRGLGDAG